MLLTQWSTVGDACDGNYYYEQTDWVVTLGILIFILDCAGVCKDFVQGFARGTAQYEKAASSNNP